ncbi:MAG: AsmA family protein [Pseudomonadota bacterium]
MAALRSIRWAFYAFWSLLLGLVVLAGIALLVAGRTDWSVLKPELEALVSDQIGGTLALDGALSVNVLPRPGFTLGGFRITGLQGGADDSGKGGTISAGATSGDLALWPLLYGKVEISDLVIEGLKFDLALPAGQAGDTQGGGKAQTGTHLHPVLPRTARIAIAEGILHERDTGEVHTWMNSELEANDLAFIGPGPDDLVGRVTLSVESFTSRGDGDVNISNFWAQFERDSTAELVTARVESKLATGALTKLTKLTFNGQVSQMRNLVQGGDVGIEGDAAIGDLALTGKGKITTKGDSTTAAINVSGKLEGNALISMIAGTPVDGAGTTAKGKFIYRRHHYEYADFEAVIAGSAAKGGIVYTARETRPLVTGDLALDQVTLSGETPAAPAGKIIPPIPLRISGLSRADLDAKLSIAHLNVTSKTQITKLSSAIKIKDGKLTLAPLSGHMGPGKIHAVARIDPGTKPQRLDLDVTISDVPLAEYAVGWEDFVAGKARGDLKARISGAGDTLDQLAGSLSGNVQTDMSGGNLKLGPFTRMVAGAQSIFEPIVYHNDMVAIACTASRWHLDKGRAESRGLIMDTSEFAVAGRGSADLRTETLNLNMAVHPTNEKFYQFSTAFHVRGTLAAPTAGTEAVSAITGIVNVAGATINPLGAIVRVQQDDRADPAACLQALDTSATEKKAPKGFLGSIAVPVVKGTVNTAGAIVEGTGEAIGNTLEEIGEGIGGIFEGSGDKAGQQGDTKQD